MNKFEKIIVSGLVHGLLAFLMCLGMVSYLHKLDHSDPYYLFLCFGVGAGNMVVGALREYLLPR